MKAKVIDLIKDLGFNIVATSAVHGDEDARVHAENGSLTIITSVTSSGFGVTIKSGRYAEDDATFYFENGALPDLRFRKYTPELLKLARRFGAIAWFDI